MEMGGSKGDDKIGVVEEGVIGDKLLGGPTLIRRQQVKNCNSRDGVAGDSDDKVERGKMRGRDKTSRLEGDGIEKIEECSKKVTSIETKYRCVSGE